MNDSLLRAQVRELIEGILRERQDILQKMKQEALILRNGPLEGESVTQLERIDAFLAEAQQLGLIVHCRPGG